SDSCSYSTYSPSASGPFGMVRPDTHTNQREKPCELQCFGYAGPLRGLPPHASPPFCYVSWRSKMMLTRPSLHELQRAAIMTHSAPGGNRKRITVIGQPMNGHDFRHRQLP